MKITWTDGLAILLVALLNGCASPQSASPIASDSAIEAPQRTGSTPNVEVHGYISTSVGTEIK